jgi:heterodisulfide reductase subunit B
MDGKAIMKFALFLGCTIPARLPQYESSSRSVLGKLGVELVNIKEFNCCGYPLRNINFKAAVLSSARNLALAERESLNILVLCKCGFGMLKHAAHFMKEIPALRKEINAILKKEGLTYEGDIVLVLRLSRRRSPNRIRSSRLLPTMGAMPSDRRRSFNLMIRLIPRYLITWWG